MLEPPSARVCHYSIPVERLQTKGLKNIGKSSCRPGLALPADKICARHQKCGTISSVGTFCPFGLSLSKTERD